MMLFSNSGVFLVALAMGFITPSLAFAGYKVRFSEFCDRTDFHNNNCTLTAFCGKTNDRKEKRILTSINLNECMGIVKNEETGTGYLELESKWGKQGPKKAVCVTTLQIPTYLTSTGS